MSGHKVILIAKKDRFHKYFNAPNLQKKFIHIEERGVNILSELKTFIHLFNIYRNIKTDLIFHFTIKPNIYGSIIAKILKIKSISFITGVGLLFINKKSYLSKIIIPLYKVALKNVYKVWFTNKHDKDLFLKNKIVKKSQFDIVPGAGVIFKIIKERDLSKDKYIFTMISRLQKEKGIEEFLYVARQYKDNKNIEFRLIGNIDNDDPSGIDQNKLNKYISDDSLLHFNYQDDIENFLLESNCIIHPSYREGISTILIEAASLMIPIITTTVPGCIDVIPNNEHGLLCKSNDKNSLKDAVDTFISMDDNKIKRKTQNAYNHVKANFERQKILNIYIEAIENIL